MEQPAVGPGRGARTSGGTLPRLDTEEGWERKEGGYGAEHEETGVPAGSRGREKCPVDFGDWWDHSNLGITFNSDEFGDGLLYRASLAEGVGTAAWVFFLLLTWMSLQESRVTDVAVIRVALAAGLSYAVLNWGFHGVSGGHFNPAVTLGLLCNGRITITRAICYWVSQIIGGIVGAAMARGMSPGAFRAINGGANRLSIGWRSAFMGEIFGTMLLVGAFLVAYDRRRRLSSDTVNVLAPWMLGMAVTAAHLFLVPYTWCSINPARSFGSAVLGSRWTSHWVWWVAPIIGSIGASMLYELAFKHFHSTTLDKGTRGSGGHGKVGAHRDTAQTVTGYP